MVNKVTLVGRLGKDPEVRHLENGAVVASFSVATSERYKDREGNRQEKTEWHNISAWRYLAEFSEKYLNKGTLVYIDGKLKTRSWEDKEGNKRTTTEIVAQTVQFLGGRGGAEGGNPPMDRNSSPDSSGGSGGVGPPPSDPPF